MAHISFVVPDRGDDLDSSLTAIAIRDVIGIVVYEWRICNHMA